MLSSIGSRVLFRGGRVFDGSGAVPAEPDVTVENGRIVDIGGGLDGDTLVDVTGKCLLPGLFDCHTHVAFTTIVGSWGQSYMGMVQWAAASTGVDGLKAISVAQASADFYRAHWYSPGGAMSLDSSLNHAR